VLAALSRRRSRVQIPSGPLGQDSCTSCPPGQVAQSVERAAENRKVGGSIPSLPTTFPLVSGPGACLPCQDDREIPRLDSGTDREQRAMSRTLVQVIAQVAVFLEFADESVLNLDAAVKQQEDMARHRPGQVPGRGQRSEGAGAVVFHRHPPGATTPSTPPSRCARAAGLWWWADCSSGAGRLRKAAPGRSSRSWPTSWGRACGGRPRPRPGSPRAAAPSDSCGHRSRHPRQCGSSGSRV
jgi:hypothetical protein